MIFWPVTMRIHLSRDILTAWRALPPEVRRFIESLKRNPRLADAMTFEDQPDHFEEFIAGYWIGWLVDESTGETIIRVTLSDTE